jgi:hypothetical protein
LRSAQHGKYISLVLKTLREPFYYCRNVHSWW